MAYIQERLNSAGKIRYRVQIRLKGYPVTTATFARKTDAKNWIQKVEAAMREKRYFKEKETQKRTVAELLDRYIKVITPQKSKNNRALRQHLKWWKKELGYCLLCDLAPALIAEKKDLLLNGLTSRGTTRSPATTNRYLASFSSALTLGMKEWGWVEDNPMRRVTKLKEPRGRVRFLDEIEKNSLLEACKKSPNPYLYLVVLIALSTGMRQGEILHLRWENLALHSGRVTLEETKNGDRRSVFLPRELLELIKTFKEERKQDFGLLFPSARFNNQPANLRAAWEQALKVAQIKNFRFHDLRHSAASYLAMSGATPSEMAEILGHRTLAMVKRYAHISDQHSANVLKKMNEKFLTSIL